MSDFRTDLARGESIEPRLDAQYCREFTIFKADARAQGMGIDRFFRKAFRHWNRAEVPQELGALFTVEYKADFRARRTGQVFIEMQQRRGPSCEPFPGWALKILAQYLLIVIPGAGQIFWIPTTSLKERLHEWIESCHWSQWVEAPNGYAARGFLLPIGYVREIATRVDKLDDRPTEKTFPVNGFGQ